MDSNPREMDIITIQNVDLNPFQVIYDGKSWGDIAAGQIRRFPRFLAEHVVKHLIDQILNRLEKPTSNLVMRAEWAAKIVIDEEEAAQPRALTAAEKLDSDIKRLNQGSDLDNILNKHKQREAEIQKEEAAALVPPPAPAPVQPLAVEDINVSSVPPAVAEPAPETLRTEAPAILVPTPVQDEVRDAMYGIKPEPVIESVNEQPAEVNTPPVQEPAPEPEVPQSPEVNEPPAVAQTPPAPVQVDNVVDPSLPTREALYAWARDNMHLDITEPKTKTALDATPVPQLIEDLQYAP